MGWREALGLGGKNPVPESPHAERERKVLGALREVFPDAGLTENIPFEQKDPYLFFAIKFKPANPDMGGADTYLVTTDPAFSRKCLGEKGLKLKEIDARDVPKDARARHEGDYVCSNMGAFVNFVIKAEALEKAVGVAIQGRGKT